jgi:hypothetical protein
MPVPVPHLKIAVDERRRDRYHQIGEAVEGEIGGDDVFDGTCNLLTVEGARHDTGNDWRSTNDEACWYASSTMCAPPSRS